MKYELGQNYDFEVIHDFGNDEDFFRLKSEEYGELRLPKLKFQKLEPLPQYMRCRIKYFDNGIPVLGHFMPQYVTRIYAEGYAKRREFEFTVLSRPNRPGAPFIIEDKHGITYKLYENKALLVVGQKIYCHFKNLNNARFELELSDSSVRLPFYSPQDFFKKIDVNPSLFRFYEHLITTLPNVLSEIKDRHPRWIITAIKNISTSLSGWLEQINIKRHAELLNILINDLRNAGLYIIENSQYLKNLSPEQRRDIQSMITEFVEDLQPYQLTVELLSNGKENDFVEELMAKLRSAGYLYHPVEQLAALMLVFKTSPNLVKKYLRGIFETISEWDIETWNSEPFKTAFVRQFEIYIQQAQREIDHLPQAETEEEFERISKITTAIVLQILISGDIESAQARRNRSLLYRYASLVRPIKTDDLLEKALLTLLGTYIPIEFKYEDIKEPMMLITTATIRPNEEFCQIKSTHTNQINGIDITIDSNGITLRRSDEKSQNCIIPANVMPWFSPQIYLDSASSIKGNGINKLEAHRTMWFEIENALFEHKEVINIQTPKQKADIGDNVHIIIDPTISHNTENPIWACTIDDENYIADRGCIYRSEIVTFKLTSNDLERNPSESRTIFSDDNGSPLHFYAKVKDIDYDGFYHFSLLDDAADQCSNNFNFADTYKAVITKDLGPDYSAISERGYGVFLQPENEDDKFEPGDIVYFRVQDCSNASHISGTIIDLAPEYEVLDKVQAIKSLMHHICIADSYQDNDSKPYDMLEDDEILTPEDIAEIIEIFRFKAFSCKQIIEAYDYLQFARILALVINNQAIASLLATHSSLLQLHQFYAKNLRIDADELEKQREYIYNSPILEILFHRLEIVSWLGKEERNPELWETINSPRNDLETTLAKMVLSYNMLPQNEDGESDLKKGIKNKIASLLGVNFESKALKYYGEEGTFKEFKSTIIYPATDKKNEKAEPNPQKQQFVILKVIASFMNSSGGTLYIGVNDKTKYEVGLHEDFEYLKRHQLYTGKIAHTITDIDRMCNFLTCLIREQWGANVSEYIQVEVDVEASRDVIAVKVQPRYIPVSLDGYYFVRNNSSSYALKEDEIKEFLEERKLKDEQRKAILRTESAETTVTEYQPAPINTDNKVVKEENVKKSVPTKKIETSLWRNNVLHHYDDGFANPQEYIYIYANNTLEHSDSDLYCENDASLALALSENEVNKGFLLLVFENQRILKVPISEIIEKPKTKTVKFYNDTVIFATIAMPEDALLTILSDNKGALYRRAIPIGDIEAGHLTSNPENFADIPGVNETVACELVATDAFENFEDSFTQNLSSRQIGYVLRCYKDSEKASEIIISERKNCAPRK